MTYQPSSQTQVTQNIGLSSPPHLKPNRNYPVNPQLDHFQIMFEQASVGIARVHLQGQFVWANQHFSNLLGWSLNSLCHYHLSDLISPPESSKSWLLPLLLKQQSFIQLEQYYQPVDGHRAWGYITISLATTPVGEPDYFIIILQNISDRKQAELDLHRHNRVLQARVAQNITQRQRFEQDFLHARSLAQVTLEVIGDAVITTNAQGQIRYLNPSAEQLTGWLSHQAHGCAIHEVFRVVNETNRQAAIQLVDKVLATGQIATTDQQALLIAQHEHEYIIDHSASPICDRRGQILGVVIVFRDISQSRQLTQQMSWQANHDALTGLVNRYHFEQQLQQALYSAQQEHVQHVLCHLDLDQFKIVNDTCGHGAGDELLRQVAQLLQPPIRSTDIIARLGGDEFGVLLHQCSHDRAQVIAHQLSQKLQAFRFTWHQQTFSIGVSIGLVTINYDSQNITSLLSAADAACDAAKARGPNRIHIYQLDNLELLQQRGTQRWSRRIKQALEDNRFRLYGQAIVPTSPDNNGLWQCCEVLLRMVDERDQIVSAASFIPAAERYNLMPEIDRWVIHQFLTDHFGAPQIDQQSPAHPSLYMINLSGASIGDEQFLLFLQEQFQQYPHAAHQICFEITETAAISDLNQALKFIQDLKQLGCRFALDDFGSGLSSFAYLKSLPVDYLKIDGHFIQDMVKDPATQAIVESINHIGHVMGLKTIAESVGDLSTRKQLQTMGIDYVQGFGIALPCSLTYQ